MWREGLLIQLKLLGIEWRIFNLIQDFMEGRVIQVKIGREISNPHKVDTVP